MSDEFDPSNLSVVIAAYKIDSKQINLFAKWNHDIFVQSGVDLVVVTNKEVSPPYPWVKIVVYPTEQKRFSIPKTINYGIKSVKHNGIVIKSDIDIVFSPGIIEVIRKRVKPGFGLVCKSARAKRGGGKFEGTKFSHKRLTPQVWEKSRIMLPAKGACFALSVEDWYKLRGYNEELVGWGSDDSDMWNRAEVKISMCEDNRHPLLHMEHKARTSHKKNGFFQVRSGENGIISRFSKWGETETWGEGQ